MKPKLFLKHIKNRTTIQHLETTQLKEMVDNYPYFQSARALYLKGLKNVDSFKYNNELKLTAAFTVDRSILFEFITSPSFTNKKTAIHKQISNKIAEKITNQNKTKKEELLSLGEPLLFTKNESFSFNEWLQISTQKPIKRRSDNKEKKEFKKEEIIDKFISSNPKIMAVTKDKTFQIPVSKNIQDESLMTETLAKVYVEQKKYENAIQAFRILSLKYPEKSTFFADRIKKIEIFQKNKS